MMKQKYRLWQRRGGVYYAFDRETKKQISLGTKDKTQATRLLHAKIFTVLEDSLGQLFDIHDFGPAPVRPIARQGSTFG